MSHQFDFDEDDIVIGIPQTNPQSKKSKDTQPETFIPKQSENKNPNTNGKKPTVTNDPFKQSKEPQVSKKQAFETQDISDNNDPDLGGFIPLEEKNTRKYDPKKEYDPTVEYDDEVPILEELGISPQRIKEKIFSVLTIHKVDKIVLEDADMAGPFLIFIIFAVFLILQKKTHFGYIYGITLFGGFILSTLMNLMSRKESILLYNTISVLGYCMIPVVLTSFIGIFLSLKQFIGIIVCMISIGASSYTATMFFEEVLAMQSQKWLVFYPVLLFYSSFVLLTVY